MDDSILAKFPDDDHVLGPFLGNLPEILDVVVQKLGWFQTTFAMAGRTCREAVERVPSTRAVLSEEELATHRAYGPVPTPLAVVVIEADVEALEWLMQRFDAKRMYTANLGCPLSWLAAKRGKIESLKCLRANGCPWNERTCMYAAKGGHLKVLQWARQHRCPWDEEGVREGGGGRAPRGASVGASERVLLGLDDVLVRGFGRPS